MRPPAGAKDTKHSYARIPDGVFCVNTPATRSIANLLEYFLGLHSPEASAHTSLLAQQSFYWAFSRTFRKAKPTCPSFFLKRRIDAWKSEVSIPTSVFAAFNELSVTKLDPTAFRTNEKGQLQVPRRVRDAMLRVVNDAHSIRTSLDDACNLRSSLLGRPASLKHWERFRLLCPKASGALSKLSVGEASYVTTPQDLATVVLQGREFWFEKPRPLDPHLTSSLLSDVHGLHPSQARALPISKLSLLQATQDELFPSTQDFYSAIVKSLNTSPGIDGVPYSAFRATPERSASVLRSLFCNIVMKEPAPHTTQLLVWIPKAVAGDKPDNWRPLSMPRVFDRLLDKVVFAKTYQWFEKALHPAQSLISVIKDPQFNYLEAQRYLLRPGPLKSCLLVDLAKAFERVNFEWLLTLLQFYNAPDWLQTYREWTYAGRSTVAKIKNTLTSAVAPLVGLDMGRACSVLFFCLTIDPLIRRHNSLSLQVLRAYMDDTTIAAHGLEWLPAVQQGFVDFEPVGISVDTHNCCLFSGLTDGSTARAGTASWKRAALEALASSRADFFTVVGTSSLFPREDLVKIAASSPEGLALTAKLVALPCQCKAKTAIVPSAQLTTAELAKVDDTPFGAKVLRSCDVTLGLPLASRCTHILPLAVDGAPIPRRKQKLKVIAAKHFNRTMTKLRSRARKVVATLTPGTLRALYWTAYCQSMTYYQTSCFELSSTALKALQRLSQQVLLGRAWLRGRYVADLFSALRIGPSTNIAQACLRSRIVTCLRMYGLPAILAARKTDPLVYKVQQYLRQWKARDAQTYGSAIQSLQASFGNPATKPPSKRAANKFALYLKQHQKAIVSNEALAYLVERCERSAWMSFSIYPPSQLITSFTNTHIKLFSRVDRLYVLRWLVDEEADFALLCRTRQVPLRRLCSCGCRQLSGLAPFGPCGLACCRVLLKQLLGEYPWAAFTPCAWRSELTAAHGIAFPTLPSLVTKTIQSCCEIRLCPLCGLGVSTVLHWLLFCPVTGVALTDVLATPWTPLLLWTLTDTAKLKALACIAAIRRYLFALGEIGNVVANSTHTQLEQNLATFHSNVANVQMTRHRILLSEAFKKKCEPSCASPEQNVVDCCPRLHTGNLLYAAPSLITPIPQPNSYKCSPLPKVSKLAHPEQELACFEEGSRLFSVLTAVQATDTNARLLLQDCLCGQQHYVLIATKHIYVGESIVIERNVPLQAGVLALRPTVQTASFDTLLFQTDGSFLRTTLKTAGGGGFVCWGLSGTSLPIPLVFLSVSFPDATDSMHAEALTLHAAAKWFEAHAEELAARMASTLVVYFQMDNLPLVTHFNVQAKCTHLACSQLVAQTKHILCALTANVVLEYVPREANFFADYAAGLASKKMLDLEPHAMVPQPEHLSLPFLCEMRPFDKYRADEPDLCLVERPAQIRHLITKFKYDLKSPGSKEDVLSYLSLIEHCNQEKFGLQVSYSLRRGKRLYATKPAAQWLPKSCRLFLFGLTHWELDMVAAAFQIYIYAATGALRYQGMDAREWRQCIYLRLKQVGSRCSHEDVKQIVNSFLNTSAVEAIKSIRRLTLFPPPEVVNLFKELDALRPKVLLFAGDKGFCESDFEPHNRMYFAMEFIEQLFVRQLVECLGVRTAVDSMVYLFDGLLLSPPPTDLEISAIASEAAKIVGLPSFPLEYTNPLPRWEAAYSRLQLTVPLGEKPAKSRKLTANNEADKHPLHKHTAIGNSFFLQVCANRTKKRSFEGAQTNPEKSSKTAYREDVSTRRQRFFARNVKDKYCAAIDDRQDIRKYLFKKRILT